MLDEKTSKLQLDVAKGAEYQSVLENYIQPFVDEKARVLFEHFSNTPVGDVDTLQAIRYQLTAIRALESHFIEFVNTGKLSEKQLEN